MPHALRAGWVWVLLLAGCASAPHDSVTAPNAGARGAGPYAADSSSAVQTNSATWQLSDRVVSVTLSTPAQRGPMPVVLFVPGLGQVSDDAALWRAHWAGAGYAVVAVQPLADDASAWSSALARAGEFKALGRERYSDSEMVRRLHVLGEVVAQAQRLTAAGQDPWQSIDWDHAAVAGYDLGAYTALVVAGERVGGADPVSVGVQPRAVIAVSPYAHSAAERAGEGGAARYAAITAPVLCVSGDADTDLLGLLSSPEARKTAHQHILSSPNELLWLQGLRHASLSGDAASLRAAPDRGGGARAPNAPGDSDATPTKRAPKRKSPLDASTPSAEQRLSIAQDVSTAFLDAYVRDRPAARAWLDAAASDGFAGAATLTRK